MDKFLQTKRGLEYLLETFPSDMPVIDAIDKVEKISNVKGNFRNQVVVLEGTVPISYTNIN